MWCIPSICDFNHDTGWVYVSTYVHTLNHSQAGALETSQRHAQCLGWCQCASCCCDNHFSCKEKVNDDIVNNNTNQKNTTTIQDEDPNCYIRLTWWEAITEVAQFSYQRAQFLKWGYHSLDDLQTNMCTCSVPVVVSTSKQVSLQEAAIA